MDVDNYVFITPVHSLRKKIKSGRHLIVSWPTVNYYDATEANLCHFFSRPPGRLGSVALRCICSHHYCTKIRCRSGNP